ncbi:MAG TPA: pyridoxamine 5'-phosphate oxidase family protein [Verrucomicrobiae bacterium]|nr:pyridoxamine 5'-phosphate oxidase family protein [Verrucomicrobiae bacterium]
MNNEELETAIREYIPQIIHMSLATVKDNKPWVCEVHFSYDDQLNLYFVSSQETRHATELLSNPHVAGNIVTQHHKNQKVRCVDFEGTASMLEGDEAEATAYKAYVDRYGASEGLLNEIRKDGNTRFFKIAVDKFYMFDSYEQERAKHTLPWNGGNA